MACKMYGESGVEFYGYTPEYDCPRNVVVLFPTDDERLKWKSLSDWAYIWMLGYSGARKEVAEGSNFVRITLKEAIERVGVHPFIEKINGV